MCHICHTKQTNMIAVYTEGNSVSALLSHWRDFWWVTECIAEMSSLYSWLVITVGRYQIIHGHMKYILFKHKAITVHLIVKQGYPPANVQMCNANSKWTNCECCAKSLWIGKLFVNACPQALIRILDELPINYTTSITSTCSIPCMSQIWISLQLDYKILM